MNIEFILKVVESDIECGFKTAHEAIENVIEAYESHKEFAIAKKIREQLEGRENNFALHLTDWMFEHGKLNGDSAEVYGLREFIAQRVSGQISAREFNTLVLGWMADESLMNKYEDSFMSFAEVLVSAEMKHVEMR